MKRYCHQWINSMNVLNHLDISWPIRISGNHGRLIHSVASVLVVEHCNAFATNVWNSSKFKQPQAHVSLRLTLVASLKKYRQSLGQILNTTESKHLRPTSWLRVLSAIHGYSKACESSFVDRGMIVHCPGFNSRLVIVWSFWKCHELHARAIPAVVVCVTLCKDIDGLRLDSNREDVAGL